MNRTRTVRPSFAASLPSALGLLVLGALSAGCGGGGSSGGGGGAAPATVPTSGAVAPVVVPEPTPPPPTSPTPSSPSSTPPPATTAPSAPATGGEAAPTGATRLGMNLGGVSYYAADWPFVDAMRASRVNATGYAWDLVSNGLPAPALDADGYPKGLGTGQAVSTLFLRATGGHYPGGAYTLMFDGDGAVQVGWDAATTTVTNDGQGTASRPIVVTPTSEGVQLRIVRSNAANHVRNIRFIMPGFEGTYATQPFHPQFVERLRAFGALRFMDWGRTNDSSLVRWSSRTTPSSRSQGSARGVSFELMLALANTLQRDPWICVPHAADDDFVRQLATLVRDRLSPGLRVHIEYSNEVWNGIFGQSGYVKSVAAAKGRTWLQQYSIRSVEIFKLFEATFGGTARLVRVIAGQSDNYGVAKGACDALPAGAADALAIAPYFGGKLGNSANWQTTRTWSVDQVLNACATDLTRCRDMTRSHKALATSKGLTLVAYEGGQHLAGVGSAASDLTLTNLFIAANRHSRMKQLYKDYLAMWKAEGGALFVAFNYCYAPQKWGSWGALERQNQPTAPKYEALIETADAWR